MGINEQYFSAAMERLEERRRANRLESDMRRSEVESKIPEYRELSLKLGETGSEIVRLVMRGGDTSKELAEVERRNLEIQKRLAELLYENGYPEDYLKPIYTCPICQEEIVFDEDTLDSGEIRCPKCGEKLEFDLSDLANAKDSEDDE